MSVYGKKKDSFACPTAAPTCKQLVEIINGETARVDEIMGKTTNFLTEVKLKNPSDAYRLSENEKSLATVLRISWRSLRLRQQSCRGSREKRTNAERSEFEMLSKLSRKHSDEDVQSKALAILGGECKANALISVNIRSDESSAIDISKILKDAHLPAVP